MKRDNKSLTPVDWLAMGVFVAGAFGTVLMGLSAFSDDVSTKGGTAKIATEWIAAAGLAPSLLFNAAVAFLGARTPPGDRLISGIRGRARRARYGRSAAPARPDLQ